MEITVKCKYYNNMQTMIDALLKEGYTVKIDPVMKSYPRDNEFEYFNVSFSNNKDTENDLENK